MKSLLRTSLFPLAGGVLVDAALCLPAAHAQVLYGSVIGDVTDASGGAVPNAKVTLTGSLTGLSREAVTDGAGRYSFVNVLPGRYTLKVAASGFRAFAESDFDV